MTTILKARGIEQMGERLVGEREPARIGAESGKDATPRIRGKAAPPHPSGPGRDMRDRVQMARDLALRAKAPLTRLVTGGDPSDDAGGRMVPRQADGRARIVISRDPDPIAPELQGAQGGPAIEAQT